MAENTSKRGIITVLVVFGGMFVMFFLFAFIAIASMNEDAFDFGSGERVGIVEVNGPIRDLRQPLAAKEVSFRPAQTQESAFSC